MLYQPIESPAMMAWDLAEIRLVTSNELEITGEIKLNDLFDVFGGEDETTLVGTDAEYYLFLLNDTD